MKLLVFTALLTGYAYMLTHTTQIVVGQLQDLSHVYQVASSR